MINNKEILEMLIKPDDFLDISQAKEGELTLVCAEVLTAMERYEKIALADSLLKEENALAVAIYSELNEEFNWVETFALSNNSFIVCSGIRVVSDEVRLYLRFPKPLPFPIDFTAFDLNFEGYSDYKFKVHDLKNRHSSLNQSVLNPNLVGEIKSLSKVVNSQSDFLDKVSAINNTAAFVCKRINLSKHHIEQLILNNEVLV